MTVTFADLLELPMEEPDEVLFYGETAQQFGELWVPVSSSPGLLVVLLHGGCWQNAYDLSHLRPAAAALRDAGYLVWSIEYRRIGDVGGAWPGTLEDVGVAVDHAGTLASKYGLLSQSILLMGHSAGGQLALWAAARRGFSTGHPFHQPRALKPKAVIGLAPITDLRTFAAGQSDCEQATRELLGPVETQGARYAATSPLELLPTGVAITQIHGNKDSIVPLAQAQAYHLRAIETGDRSQLYRVPEAGHFDLIHPGMPAWQTVAAAIREYA